jgi:hypothetical protein
MNATRLAQKDWREGIAFHANIGYSGREFYNA